MAASERLPPIDGPLVKIIEHTDGDLKFHFILTKTFAQKPTLSTPPPKQQRSGSDIDTNGYEIDDSGNSHFLIANKFSFSRPHLMMLTCDGYRRQHEPLDKSDLEASWATLVALNDAATNYVVFYNCGRDGGCSRLHKHMQLMPLPADGFAAAFLDSNVAEEPRVPFEWFYHRFENGAIDSATIDSIYTKLLQQATEAWVSCTGNVVPDGEACPHNVAFTSRWLVVILRRRGAINKEAGREIENWIRLGLTKSLQELGVTREKSIAQLE
ncbi:hypothetical protein ACQKWADRAFT_322729 [Trichoderma austrokoningii]